MYAITSQEEQIQKETLESLNKAGVLDDIVVVMAREYGSIHSTYKQEIESAEDNSAVAYGVAAAQASEAITVSAAACSIAEVFALAEGDDTFVVVDDIDQHKNLWDWTARVLVDVYGVDSVVKDDINGGASSEMRAFYSGFI